MRPPSGGRTIVDVARRRSRANEKSDDSATPCDADDVADADIDIGDVEIMDNDPDRAWGSGGGAAAATRRPATPSEADGDVDERGALLALSLSLCSRESGDAAVGWCGGCPLEDGASCRGVLVPAMQTGGGGSRRAQRASAGTTGASRVSATVHNQKGRTTAAPTTPTLGDVNELCRCQCRGCR